MLVKWHPTKYCTSHNAYCIQSISHCKRSTKNTQFIVFWGLLEAFCQLYPIYAQIPQGYVDQVVKSVSGSTQIKGSIHPLFIWSPFHTLLVTIQQFSQKLFVKFTQFMPKYSRLYRPGCYKCFGVDSDQGFSSSTKYLLEVHFTHGWQPFSNF